MIRWAIFIAIAVLAAVGAWGQQTPASISGHTVGGDGKPLAGVMIVLMQNGHPPNQVTSGPNGSFSFNGLAAGNWQLRATRDGYLPAMQTGPSAAGDYTLRLAPEATISGTIVGEDGTSVNQMQIRAVRQSVLGGGAFAGATSDEKGEFRITGVAAGHYSLYCSPSSSETKYVPGQCPGATALDVAEGQNRTGVAIRLHANALVEIRGKVENQLDPAAHFQILYAPQSADQLSYVEPRVASVQPDGTFELKDVFPDRSWSLTLMSVHGLAKAVGMKTVAVKEQNVSDVVLTAGAPVDVKGTLRMDPPGPIAPASMIVLRLADTPTAMPIRITPAADGSFTFPNLARGHYLLAVNSGRAYVVSAKYGEQDVLNSGLDLTREKSTLEIVAGTASAEMDVTVRGTNEHPAGGAFVLLVPDPPQQNRRELYRAQRVGNDGHASLMSIAPGKYRLIALDAAEMMGGFSMDAIDRVSSHGTSVTVEKGAKSQAAVDIFTAPEKQAAAPPSSTAR
jgi:hypothetical protein